MLALSSPSAAPDAQVVVLGMHRSGTSALTGLLRLLGLWAGEEDDFPPADGHNEAGILGASGCLVGRRGDPPRARRGAWSEIADLDLSRLKASERARFEERARRIVRDLDRHGSWIVKDPRLCLLFPFWREVLEHPFCVLIYREPLPVARSLAARDGLPIPFGIALWEGYMREALASTRGLPRVLVSHRELMADPAATLRRLHRHLAQLGGPSLLHLRVPAAEEIRTVVDPALVHHPDEPEAERLYLTLPQLALLDALASGTALDLDPVPPVSPERETCSPPTRACGPRGATSSGPSPGLTSSTPSSPPSWTREAGRSAAPSPTPSDVSSDGRKSARWSAATG